MTTIKNNVKTLIGLTLILLGASVNASLEDLFTKEEVALPGETFTLTLKTDPKNPQTRPIAQLIPLWKFLESEAQVRTEDIYSLSLKAAGEGDAEGEVFDVVKNGAVNEEVLSRFVPAEEPEALLARVRGRVVESRTTFNAAVAAMAEAFDGVAGAVAEGREDLAAALEALRALNQRATAGRANLDLAIRNAEQGIQGLERALAAAAPAD